MLPSFVSGDLEALGLSLTADATSVLSRYVDLFLETNQKFNLSSVRDREGIWRRHIIDSLTLVPFLEGTTAGSTIIDVGAGGGLPGIPLAVVRPDLQMTLVEATAKKAAFCGSCGGHLALTNLRVINDRAEQIAQMHQHRQHYDVAVCRAIGPMTQMLEYTLPLIGVGGRLMAMKGPKAEAELEAAGDAMDMLGGGELQVYSAYPDRFGIQTVVVMVTKVAKTPRLYPRLPGTARRAPL